MIRKLTQLKIIIFSLKEMPVRTGTMRRLDQANTWRPANTQPAAGNTNEKRKKGVSIPLFYAI